MMYVITYDINRIFANRAGLFAEIRELGPWCKYMDRTWFVGTHLSVDEVVSRLNKFLAPNDRLLVTRLTPPYQGWLPGPAWDWIQEHYPEYGYY